MARGSARSWTPTFSNEMPLKQEELTLDSRRDILIGVKGPRAQMEEGSGEGWDLEGSEVAAARTGFSRKDFLMVKGQRSLKGILGLRSCFYPFEVRASWSG